MSCTDIGWKGVYLLVILFTVLFKSFATEFAFVPCLIEGVVEGKADAVLAASIFHYGEVTIHEVKREMYKSGIEVRI